MAMSQAAIEERRAYDRNYYAQNKDKVMARRARYWERKAAEAKENGEKDAEGGE